MYQQPLQTQLLSISYRNGVYQGYFHRQDQTREGFGLIYTTDNPMVMGSSWHQDRANSQTFVFYNHAHYTYGYWSNSIPHGFNAVRMDKIVIMGFYQMGVIKGRLLVIYEHYNLAIVLEKGEADNQFVEVLKGDIFSDQDFNNFIKGCNWPEFQDSWKTLIKFMASNFVGQQGEQSNQRPKLRLVNKQYYRFGYNQGVAIVFDDQYRIVSIGLHKKATLKSLGVRFPKQNFVEEGNFNAESQIFAFNYGHRPDGKIGKVYSNYLLKCTEFVNKYLNNPAKIFIIYLQDLIKSNLFRRLLAGQITTRKLDTSYGTPPQTNRYSTIQKEPIKNEQVLNVKNQQMQKIKQQKKRLQTYKKQLFDTINKKSRAQQRDLEESLEQAEKRKMRHQIQSNLKNTIVHKPPVQLAMRNSRKKNPTQHSRNRSRSPIFTPDHQSRSPSPSSVSPFKERMRSKIFYENKQKSKKYSYAPIEQQLYPRHSAVNMKKYNSPHQQLQFSPPRGFQNIQQVIPISVQRQNKTKNRQNDFQRKRQLQKELGRQKLLQQQRKQLQAQMEKEKEKLRNQFQQRNKPKPTATPKIKKQSTGSISFRNPYLEKEIQREFSNTNVPNIIITNQHKSKSKSPIQKRIIEPKPVSPDNQNYERGNNKKNNIYLKQNFGQEPIITNQLKKQIKGNTYLQKYNKTKTPEKSKNYKNDTESKKYNMVIKSFNENNKIYEKISSPEKKKPPKNVQFEDQFQEPKEQKQIDNKTPPKVDYKQKYIESSPIVKKFNESTPTKKKYQYIYE